MFQPFQDLDFRTIYTDRWPEKTSEWRKINLIIKRRKNPKRLHVASAPYKVILNALQYGELMEMAYNDQSYF